MGRDQLIPEQYGPQASALRGAPAGSVYSFGPGHIRVRCKPERLLSITHLMFLKEKHPFFAKKNTHLIIYNCLHLIDLNECLIPL